MKTTQEVKEILRKQLGREPIKAISFVGSQPELLDPQADLDIVIIVDAKKYNEAMDLIERTAKEISTESITYSFSNGPLKFENQALLHFLIFTDDDVNLTENPAYSTEKNSVRYCQQQTATPIFGPHLETFAKGELHNNSGSWMKNSIARFKEKGHILRTWVKNDSWDYKRIKIDLTPWQEQELLSYYAKWQSKNSQKQA